MGCSEQLDKCKVEVKLDTQNKKKYNFKNTKENQESAQFYA